MLCGNWRLVGATAPRQQADAGGKQRCAACRTHLCGLGQLGLGSALLGLADALLLELVIGHEPAQPAVSHVCGQNRLALPCGPPCQGDVGPAPGQVLPQVGLHAWREGGAPPDGQALVQSAPQGAGGAACSRTRLTGCAARVHRRSKPRRACRALQRHLQGGSSLQVLHPGLGALPVPISGSGGPLHLWAGAGGQPSLQLAASREFAFWLGKLFVATSACVDPLTRPGGRKAMVQVSAQHMLSDRPVCASVCRCRAQRGCAATALTRTVQAASRAAGSSPRHARHSGSITPRPPPPPPRPPAPRRACSARR